MSKEIPLIRAAALMPMVRWMLENGRPVEDRLAAADLAYVPLDNPAMPIPAFSVARFFRDASRAEGPDIGCRVVSKASIVELAMIGKVALGTRNPHEALLRVAAAMPFHSSHEHFVLSHVRGGILLHNGWSVSFDDETINVIQQFEASILQSLIRLTSYGGRPFVRLEMVPHPEAGIDFLRPWFGQEVFPSRTRALTIQISQEAAESPFRSIARERSLRASPSDPPRMNPSCNFSGSAKIVIAGMMGSTSPSVERLAAAAGLSVRSLQRRLAEEGTSFSRLLEEVRRASALTKIAKADASLADVSASLGYGRQSALTRAVRRWTGHSPSQLRGYLAD